MENKLSSLLVVSLGKAVWRDFPHIDVVDRWPATPKRARYSASIAFSLWEDKYITKYENIRQATQSIASTVCSETLWDILTVLVYSLPLHIMHVSIF